MCLFSTLIVVVPLPVHGEKHSTVSTVCRDGGRDGEGLGGRTGGLGWPGSLIHRGVSLRGERGLANYQHVQQQAMSSVHVLVRPVRLKVAPCAGSRLRPPEAAPPPARRSLVKRPLRPGGVFGGEGGKSHRADVVVHIDPLIAQEGHCAVVVQPHHVDPVVVEPVIGVISIID